MPRGNVGMLGSTPMVNNAIQQAQAINTPTPQQPQQQGNQVPYWGYYTNQSYFDTDPMASGYGNEFLTGLQKLDPNAQFVKTQVGGENPQDAWILQYDRSKLPTKGLVDMNEGDYAPMYYSSNDHGITEAQYRANVPYGGNFRGQLFNQSDAAFRNDPILGRVTSTRNVKPDKADWLDYLGPLLVGGFGGLLGGFGPILSAAQSVQGALRSGGNPLWSLASAAVPFIPGVSSVPFLSTGLKAGINLARRRGG